MEPVVIRNTQSPGDIIVLTTAIRDINATYPGRFRFGIDTIERSIWAHNPAIDMSLRAGRKIVAKYPLVHQSNQQKVHFMWGFIDYLNQQLRTDAKLLDFRPALYLNEGEKKDPPFGLQKPYWVFASGGKRDFTAKWWDPDEWQKVVSSMSKWMHMVQVGGGSHVHPPLDGVTNLVGRTSMRDLFRLIYHAEGVMCVVTCLMHIAAAFNRPCVVVAGGREPYYWEAYTHEGRLVNMRRGQPMWKPPEKDDFIPHRFLHTVGTAPDNLGTLQCCDHHGCWSGRVGVKPPRDRHRYCKDYLDRGGRNLPRCLSMITHEHVLHNVEWYYENGILKRDKGVVVVVPPQLPAETLQERCKPPAERLQAAVPPSTPRKPEIEAPAASISAGAVAEGDAITADCLERYGRVGASLLAISPRLKAFKAFLSQTNGASWVAWLEDPIYPRGRKWYDKLSAKLEKDPEAIWGTVCWKVFTARDEEHLKTRSWYKTSKLPAHPLDPRKTILYYPLRGWLLLPKRVAEGLPWKELTEEYLEVELGAYAAQNGIHLKDAGEMVQRG